MRLDQLPRSDNVEDRRGEDGGAGFRIPGGRGGLGIGTIIVLGLVGYWLGIDPSVLIGGAEILSGGGTSQQQSNPGPRDSAGAPDTGAPSDQMGQFVSAVLGGTETQWQKIFAQYGKAYEPPTLVMFSGVTRSACGFAQSAMGPFYCPNDHKVYLDTSFFQDLERQQAQQSRDKAEANQLQVRVELQADCLAGVWAHHSQETWNFIEPGDVEAAMQTASAIGDDRLQRQAQGYVVPDAFTHGTSQQRTRWFTTGLKSGKVESCDTFNAAQL